MGSLRASVNVNLKSINFLSLDQICHIRVSSGMDCFELWCDWCFMGSLVAEVTD